MLHTWSFLRAKSRLANASIEGFGRFCVSLLPAAAGLLLGCAPAAAIAQELSRVVAVEAQAAPLMESDDYVGSFVSPQSASLSPQLAGLVADLPYDIGEQVAADSVVFELNSELAKLAVAQAQAVVSQRRVVLAEAERLLAEVDQLPVRELLPETERLARAAATQSAAAALQIAQAERAIAQRRFDQHTVRAPFAGTVVARPAEVGEWVTPGSEVLRVVRTDALWLDLRLPQRRSIMIDRLDRIEVAVDAFPQQVFPARLVATVPSGDEESRTFQVRLAVESLPSNVVPGMSARVAMTFGSDALAVQVPRDALIRRPDNALTIWTLVSENEQWVAREKRITTGRASRDTVAVVDGLSAGDIVVIRGNETLREGQRVQATVAD